jgi:hypothetical protein
MLSLWQGDAVAVTEERLLPGEQLRWELSERLVTDEEGEAVLHAPETRVMAMTMDEADAETGVFDGE